MKVAILAVQGAFIEHEKVLQQLGVDCFEIRKSSDLEQDFDGLILPGGESTVMGKLLHTLNLYDTLKKKIQDGMPILATCAGLILLAEHLTDDDTVHFGTMPISVKRNAYGRQIGSFYTEAECKGLGTIPMTFIRAPYIDKASPEVEILATVDGHIVGARYQNQIGLSFHPELDENTAIHQLFLNTIKKAKQAA